jgi:hypothetical protein
MNKNTEGKIRVLNNPLMLQVAGDIARILNEKVLGESPATDMEYELLAREIIRKLRQKYKTQIKSMDVASQQTDLETLINDLRTGKEEVWINKLNRDDRE